MASSIRSAANRQRYTLRGRVLQHARELARTGRHAGHETILRELEAADGFEVARQWFEDRGLRAQLDRLCMLARDPAPRLSRTR